MTLKTTEKIYNDLWTPNIQIGNHSGKTYFDQYGTPVQREFFYHDTAIIELNLIAGVFVCNDGGWNTNYTARYMSEYYNMLIKNCYMLSRLNIVGTSHVPKVLVGYNALKERGATMLTQSNRLTPIHFGKNLNVLKECFCDEFTVHFDEKSINRSFRNYVAISGSTLNQIIFNTIDRCGGFEIEFTDTTELKEMPVGLWYYKQTYYRVDFEVREHSVNLQRNAHRYVLYATSIYELKDKSESALIRMCGIDGLSKSIIIHNLKSFLKL